MADRQYGIQPSNRVYPGPPPGDRNQISPVSMSSNPAQASNRYRRPVPSSAPMPVPRVEARPFDAPPVPPVHYQLEDGGMQAIRDIDNLYGGRMMSPSPEPDEQIHQAPPVHHPGPLKYPPSEPLALSRPSHRQMNSQGSTAPLVAPWQQDRSRPISPPKRTTSPARWDHNHAAVAAPMGYRHDSNLPAGNHHHGDGYDGYVDPNEIEDDGDDGLEGMPRDQRGHSHLPAAMGGSAAAGAATGMFKPFGTGSRNASGGYDPVPGGHQNTDPEKSEWLQQQTSGGKRMKWLIVSLILLLIVGGIIGGVVGGVLASKNKSNSGGNSSSSSSSSGGLYDIHSSQVRALLNNTALHRVFPGMDYTPLNAQYPGCLTVPPDQNNITLDIAMLAQLTPAVRLYGTDCNQTEMVLESINRLGYNESVKVWLGVWLENNATTNARQLAQMYDILDNYPSTQFAGVIVGNEVLFRQDMTEVQLGSVLQSVRSNLTAKHIALPVATSDLGTDWTASLAQDTDIVMSNVHPFFAGVTPDEASGWAWTFWQGNDVIITGAGKAASGGWPKNVISEIGWPSDGGNDCGTNNTCPNAQAGSVAGVKEMNTFMGEWVCESMTNGTTYFW